MHTQKLVKKLLAFVVTGALVATVAVPAFADDTQTYTYEAPTAPMEVDDNIITASAHRAASPALGIFGLNAISGFGMINGSAPSNYEEAIACPALGVWGSDLNENPDPYYWNYFYNFYAAENNLPIAEDALINVAAAASPSQADNTLYEEYGNISVSLYTRPQILLGCATNGANGTDVDGYNDQLATIHSFTPDSPYYQEGDENYSPKLVSYQLTYIKDMIGSMKGLANAIVEVEQETGKTTRYGDPVQIAQDYEDYIYGVVAYVQQQLAAKGLEEKTVAVISAANEDGTYSLASTSERAYQYAEPVSKSLSDTYGTTVTVEQLMTADVIISITSKDLTKNAIEESFGANSYDGILVTTTPDSLYGVTMNSVENAMGFAFIIGCMYCDVLDLDPVELSAYFYQHFLHIDKLDSLATVVQTNFANVILPEGVSATLSADYSEAAVKAKLDAGVAYWKANPNKFVGADYERMGMGVLYTDVSENNPYYEAIQYVTNAGLFQGAGDGTFTPEVTMNRAMFAVVMYNMEGKPAVSGSAPFTDLTADWYKDAVAWCNQNQVITGTGDGSTFSPDVTVTEETIITMLYRHAKSKGLDVSAADDLNSYSDAANVSGWALDAVKWAAANNLFDGVASGGKLNPGSDASRSVVAQFMMNYSNWVTAQTADQNQGQGGGSRGGR